MPASSSVCSWADPYPSRHRHRRSCQASRRSYPCREKEPVPQSRLTSAGASASILGPTHIELTATRSGSCVDADTAGAEQLNPFSSFTSLRSASSAESPTSDDTIAQTTRTL